MTLSIEDYEGVVGPRRAAVEGLLHVLLADFYARRPADVEALIGGLNAERAQTTDPGRARALDMMTNILEAAMADTQPDEPRPQG